VQTLRRELQEEIGWVIEEHRRPTPLRYQALFAATTCRHASVQVTQDVIGRPHPGCNDLADRLDRFAVFVEFDRRQREPLFIALLARDGSSDGIARRTNDGRIRLRHGGGRTSLRTRHKEFSRRER
jgi:8-oxo-dGTP pyrophosphatase MutT (NUDIX family)